MDKIPCSRSDIVNRNAKETQRKRAKSDHGKGVDRKNREERLGAMKQT